MKGNAQHERAAQEQRLNETYGDQVGDILGARVGLCPSSAQPSLSHPSFFPEGESVGDIEGSSVGLRLGARVGLWPSSSHPSLSHSSLFQAVPVGVSVLHFQDREGQQKKEYATIDGG